MQPQSGRRHPPADKALYDTLNPLVVRSGQDGHQHAYVPLSGPIGLLQHRALQEALRDRLGGDDKIADNDLLRPGTFNHKPATAPNTGNPAEVTIEPGTPDRVGPGRARGHARRQVEHMFRSSESRSMLARCPRG